MFHEYVDFGDVGHSVSLGPEPADLKAEVHVYLPARLAVEVRRILPLSSEPQEPSDRRRLFVAGTETTQIEVPTLDAGARLIGLRGIRTAADVIEALVSAVASGHRSP